MNTLIYMAERGIWAPRGLSPEGFRDRSIRPLRHPSVLEGNRRVLPTTPERTHQLNREYLTSFGNLSINTGHFRKTFRRLIQLWSQVPALPAISIHRVGLSQNGLARKQRSNSPVKIYIHISPFVKHWEIMYWCLKAQYRANNKIPLRIHDRPASPREITSSRLAPGLTIPLMKTENEQRNNLRSSIMRT